MSARFADSEMANFFLDGHSQPPSSPTSPTETKEWDSDALAPGQVVSDYTPAPAFLVPQESEFEGASSLRIVPALLSNRSLFPSEPQSSEYLAQSVFNFLVYRCRHNNNIDVV